MVAYDLFTSNIYNFLKFIAINSRKEMYQSSKSRHTRITCVEKLIFTDRKLIDTLHRLHRSFISFLGLARHGGTGCVRFSVTSLRQG